MTPYYQDASVTIYHGDCRELLPVMLDAVAVMVTDPPYGMGFVSGTGGAFGPSLIIGDENTETRDAVLAMWTPNPALVFGRWSVPRPAETRMVLTWEKGEHVGMGDLALPWKPNTEEIYVLGRGFVGRRTTNVLRYNAIGGSGRHHPTEKPLGLMRDLIAKCPPGVIVDPFMGSGTTLRAAKDMGRRAIGIEVDERYCEVAVRRMAQEVLAL